MSSAKRPQEALLNSSMSLVLMEQSKGPRTEPWGTLYLKDCTSDVEALAYISEIFEP